MSERLLERALPAQSAGAVGELADLHPIPPRILQFMSAHSSSTTLLEPSLDSLLEDTEPRLITS